MMPQAPRNAERITILPSPAQTTITADGLKPAGAAGSSQVK